MDEKNKLHDLVLKACLNGKQARAIKTVMESRHGTFLYGPESIREHMTWIGVSLLPNGTIEIDVDIPQREELEFLIDRIAPLCLSFSLIGTLPGDTRKNSWKLQSGVVKVTDLGPSKSPQSGSVEPDVSINSWGDLPDFSGNPKPSTGFQPSLF